MRPPIPPCNYETGIQIKEEPQGLRSGTGLDRFRVKLRHSWRDGSGLICGDSMGDIVTSAMAEAGRDLKKSGMHP